MNIRYLSDLHLEMTDYQPDAFDRRECDVVILAGDIGNGVEGIEWAKRAFPDIPTLYVMGNHEYYGHRFTPLLEQARAAAKGSPVHLLECNRVDLGGIRFLGTTLWTDFELDGAENRLAAMHEAALCMNDFYSISYDHGQLFEPADSADRFRMAAAWLEAEIEATDRPVVVITHHSPSRANQNPRYAGDALTPAFHSHLDRLFKPPVRAWISGHNHYSDVVEINGIPLLSNQRGYPRENLPFDWYQSFTVTDKEVR